MWESLDRVRAEQLLFRWVWRDERLSFDDYCWLTQQLPLDVLLAAWDDAAVVRSAEAALLQEEHWLERLDAALARRRRMEAGDGES